MTTVQAASNAMPSGALAPRRVVAHQGVALREAEVQEVVHQEATVHVAEAILLPVNPIEAAEVPAATTTTITIPPAAAVVEAAADNFLSQN